MSDPIADKYEIAAIELKWQGLWREAKVEATPAPSGDGHGTYVFNTPPFTSGEAHMGHVRSCSIGDSYARFRRRQGDDVLYSCGFDAFGLPSETRCARPRHDPGGMGRPLRLADARAVHPHGLLDELGALLLIQRPGDVPLVAVDVPEAAREGVGLPAGGAGRVV